MVKAPKVLLLCVAAALMGVEAGAQTHGAPATSTSAATLEPVGDDPFSEVFEAAATKPTGESAAPAQPVGDTTRAASPASSKPAAPSKVPAVQAVAPRATSDLYIGPYLRLSGLVVQDPGFGLIAPFGALVRLEGGMEVAPFAAARGLSFEGGLGLGVQSDTSFERIKGQFVLVSFQASAIYRQPLFTYLAAYARATGALNIAHLRFAEGLDDKEVDDLKFNGSGAGTLGLELTIPLGFTPQDGDGRSASQYLGFFFEAGYEMHTNLQFSGARRDVREDSTPARIPVSSQSLGDLDLSGWIWRLGGSFRF